jgi:dihydrofolate synthase/folylpolyglutamate synthase
MTYQETIDYLFGRLPMFQRIGAAAYKADLENTVALCKILHHPEQNFPAIHIAGTNGKGSVSNMLASILQEAGYKTGLFTSPHLKDFRERIRINGNMISEAFITDFVDAYKKDFEPIGASFFEYTFALCVQYFYKEKVDVAVIETGMGGRLDSTNVVHSVVCAITNISFDHTAFLGNTLKAIATEKAGIIKPHVPVVVGERQDETTDVFLNKARQMAAPISFAEDSFVCRFKADNNMNISKNGEEFLYNIHLPLQGCYQEKNVATVMEIVSVLQKQNYHIDMQHIIDGLEKVLINTGFSGRWHVLNRHPFTVCDTAHNEGGLKKVLSQIKRMKFNKLHVVLGVVNDKDISTMLSMMPKEATYYFCKAAIPRGLDALELREKARAFQLIGNAYHSVKEAFYVAQQAADIEDMIYVGGSTFIVAEVI